MNIIVIAGLFIIGLVFIIKGSDAFVEAASYIAKITRIPPIIIGATIVSIATTMPELLVSLIATLEGHTDIAVGNVVGSVTCNIGLIMGIVIWKHKASLRKGSTIHKGILMIMAMLLLWACSYHEKLTKVGAIALIIVLILYTYMTIDEISQKNCTQMTVMPDKSAREILYNIFKFLIGGLAIFVGAKLLVQNGTVLAQIIGLPDEIIALTMIAVGTSLPELATAITAVKKGETDISVGNILGANIIDTTLILPVCTLITSQDLSILPQSIMRDMPVSLILMAICILPSWVKGKFSKWQSLALILSYLLYVVKIVI